MMKSSRIALPLLLAPALAAASNCEHEDRRLIEPDLDGVATVLIVVNSHDLVLTGTEDASAARVAVRACASDADYLPQLVVSTRRDGDTLVMEIERQGQSFGIFFRPTYARLEVEASLPAGLAYELDVGSGDASVRGVDRLDARVGSGDLEVANVGGQVDVSVGSGDVSIDGAGSLNAHSVGSGDLEARGVRGDARIGSIGSGDVNLSKIEGQVIVERIGSGDLDVNGVEGDLTVHSVGSGDVNHRGVGGEVSLPRRR